MEQRLFTDSERIPMLLHVGPHRFFVHLAGQIGCLMILLRLVSFRLKPTRRNKCLNCCLFSQPTYAISPKSSVSSLFDFRLDLCRPQYHRQELQQCVREIWVGRLAETKWEGSSPGLRWQLAKRYVNLERCVCMYPNACCS